MEHLQKLAELFTKVTSKDNPGKADPKNKEKITSEEIEFNVPTDDRDKDMVLVDYAKPTNPLESISKPSPLPSKKTYAQAAEQPPSTPVVTSAQPSGAGHGKPPSPRNTRTHNRLQLRNIVVNKTTEQSDTSSSPGTEKGKETKSEPNTSTSSTENICSPANDNATGNAMLSQFANSQNAAANAAIASNETAAANLGTVAAISTNATLATQQPRSRRRKKR